MVWWVMEWKWNEEMENKIHVMIQEYGYSPIDQRSNRPKPNWTEGPRNWKGPIEPKAG